MRRFAFVLLVVFGTLVGMSGTNSVMTMVVNRCQYTLKDGRQCVCQASNGQRFCWRHRGAAKVVGEAFQDAGQGASQAWSATVGASTNVWNATRDAAEDARKGFVELFGGKCEKANSVNR